jgi:DNA-binding NarL/FixJ family response regulator
MALTPRQREVTACVAAGWPDKITAYELGIKKDTVHQYVQVIKQIAGVSNRASLAGWWVEQLIRVCREEESGAETGLQSK